MTSLNRDLLSEHEDDDETCDKRISHLCHFFRHLESDLEITPQQIYLDPV